MEPLARQLHVLTRLAGNDREAALGAGVVVASAPASGIEEGRMSRFLMRALEKTGAAHAAVITRSPDSPILTASVDIGGGEWLISDIPDLRAPPGGAWVLAGWIVLIVAGSTAIALYAATRITKPLELLENAARSIGSDGLIAHVPETGSGEIRATARALNLLSTRLKSAVESRMRLVAAAGHDLRTPMTRMRLRAEFVEDDAERGKWLADLEELDAIADSAIRLVREETGSGTSETVKLDELVHDISVELRELGYTVTLHTLEPVEVAAKPLALKRAIRNLVLNAATHGGGATLAVARHKETAVVTISDDGPGIPGELVGQVFEPFFRVDLARRKTLPGAGLGLAIAREIIGRFNGTVTIANRSPTGLLQTIKLPV